MAKKNQEEWDKGYQAALEAIRKQIENGSKNPTRDANKQDENSPKNPDNMDGTDQGGSNGSSSEQGENGQSSTSGGSSQGQSSGKSRNGKQEGQGVVRPEDCIGPDSLDDVPGQSGAMMDKAEGDKLAKSEGYDDESKASADRIADEWKDAAKKAASQMKGDKMGHLKSKIEGLYNTTTDWKKELRKVVGYSISPEDTRRAYANKNILISQDRMARTDKTKYDSLDYIVAIIDSSGSMSDQQLKMCLSEVYSLALQKKPLSIYVIQCDTQVQDVQKFNDVRKLKQSITNATVKGRGGTDFKDAWNFLKTDRQFKGRQAELVMLFTDGWCDQYKRDPRSMANLCWVILDNPSFQLENKEPKTKVVYINTDNIK